MGTWLVGAGTTMSCDNHIGFWLSWGNYSLSLGQSHYVYGERMIATTLEGPNLSGINYVGLEFIGDSDPYGQPEWIIHDIDPEEYQLDARFHHLMLWDYNVDLSGASDPRTSLGDLQFYYIRHCGSDFRQCLNGGTCVPPASDDVNEDYTCICPTNVLGKYCETLPLDEAPIGKEGCYNGGTVSHGSCLCLPTYAGHLCEMMLSPCDSDPCPTDATCIDNTDPLAITPQYSCECPMARTGVLCETSLALPRPQYITYTSPDVTYTKCRQKVFCERSNIWCRQMLMLLELTVAIEDVNMSPLYTDCYAIRNVLDWVPPSPPQPGIIPECALIMDRPQQGWKFDTIKQQFTLYVKLIIKNKFAAGPIFCMGSSAARTGTCVYLAQFRKVVVHLASSGRRLGPLFIEDFSKTLFPNTKVKLIVSVSTLYGRIEVKINSDTRVRQDEQWKGLSLDPGSVTVGYGRLPGLSSAYTLEGASIELMLLWNIYANCDLDQCLKDGGVDINQELSIYPTLSMNCEPYFVNCQHTGECVDATEPTRDYSCLCKTGSKGKYCEELKPGTDADPLGCENNGILLDNKCVCYWPYTGVFCELNANHPCNSEPCINGASCSGVNTGTVEFYKCECAEGFSGPQCQVVGDVPHPPPLNPPAFSELPRYQGDSRVLGCFLLEEPDVGEDAVTDTELTLAKCLEHCLYKGWWYARAINGNLCSCSDTHNMDSYSISCSEPCQGDGTQVCGGAQEYTAQSTGLSSLHKNLALNQPVTVSHSLPGVDPAWTVDGNLLGEFTGGGCLLTQTAASPWWIVSLHYLSYVSRVVLFNIIDTVPADVDRVHVGLSNCSAVDRAPLVESGLFSYHVLGSASGADLQKPRVAVLPSQEGATTPALFVIVQYETTSPAPLSLCEVVVYGVPHPNVKSRLDGFCPGFFFISELQFQVRNAAPCEAGYKCDMSQQWCKGLLLHVLLTAVDITDCTASFAREVYEVVPEGGANACTHTSQQPTVVAAGAGDRPRCHLTLHHPPPGLGWKFDNVQYKMTLFAQLMLHEWNTRGVVWCMAPGDSTLLTGTCVYVSRPHTIAVHLAAPNNGQLTTVFEAPFKERLVAKRYVNLYVAINCHDKKISVRVDDTVRKHVWGEEPNSPPLAQGSILIGHGTMPGWPRSSSLDGRIHQLLLWDYDVDLNDDPRRSLGDYNSYYIRHCGSDFRQCLNGGTCVPPASDDVNEDYTCICDPSTSGKYCETLLSTAPPLLGCYNDGQLAEDGRCVCRQWYTGPRCEVELAPCHGNPCLNEGTCRTLESKTEKSFVCECQVEFTGKYCDKQLYPYTHAKRDELGCYVDMADDPDLPTFSNEIGLKITPDLCAKRCFMHGFLYSGTQSGSQCYCGNSYGKHGASSDCTTPCEGDPARMCGGELATTVYSTQIPTMNFTGCYNGPDDELAFDNLYDIDMTPRMCALHCYKKGWLYSAFVGDTDCYCGDSYSRYNESWSCEPTCYEDGSGECEGTNIVHSTGIPVENVAFHRPAYQSAGSMGPNRAVDYILGQSCSFTDADVIDPWWMVTLDEPSHVYKVNILEKTRRLHMLFVGVTNTPPTETPPQIRAGTPTYTLCAYSMSALESELSRLMCGFSAVARPHRYVVVQIDGQQILSLCDVQVFAVPAQ